MGDLFLDIDNTVFHVLLKQGAGEKYFGGDVFIILLQFDQFSIFFGSFLVFFFFEGGLGLLVSLRILTTCKI